MSRHKPTVRSFDARVVHFVETDDPEFPRFIRFSEDSWVQEMGMSYEEVTTVDVEALEAAFQQYYHSLPKLEWLPWTEGGQQ